MIIHDCEQGSREWLDLRIGVATASQFDQVITPKTQKPSASMTKYAYKLLAEKALGQSLDEAASMWMERGTELEPEARAWYELTQGVDVQQVGFITSDDGLVGCSPDGLVGEDGGLEIKCPSAAVHLGYLLGGVEDAYRCQVQGGLWVTGRAWWDFLSYCPGLPPVLVRFTREEEFITNLAAAMVEFQAMMARHSETLAGLGVTPALTMTETLAHVE